MKKIFYLTLMSISLQLLAYGGVAGCGGGNDTDTTPSASASSTLNDFTGTYTLRDENCNFTMMIRFRINQSSTQLTVLDNGGSSSFVNGDAFSISTSNDVATITALSCAAGFSLTQAQTDSFSKEAGITVQLNDLIVECIDNKASAGFCDASYKRSN